MTRTRDQVEWDLDMTRRQMDAALDPKKQNRLPPTGPGDVSKLPDKLAELERELLAFDPESIRPEADEIQAELLRLTVEQQKCKDDMTTSVHRNSGYGMIGLTREYLDRGKAVDEWKSRSRIPFRELGLPRAVMPGFVTPWGTQLYIPRTGPISPAAVSKLAAEITQHVQTFGRADAKRVFGADEVPVYDPPIGDPVPEHPPASEPPPANIAELKQRGSHEPTRAGRKHDRSEPPG